MSIKQNQVDIEALNLVITGLELIEPTTFYNLLEQTTVYPFLSDTNYLLLLDAREKHEYNESHIITAKKVPLDKQGKYGIPYAAELECKQNVIVYDSNTSDFKNESVAVKYASLLWRAGSRNPVKILKGGYETFSAMYPFLRTQQILYRPQELDNLDTYPLEIIPGLLYLGTQAQAEKADIQKDLKIGAFVNCCEEEDSLTESANKVLHIPVTDDNNCDMLSHFNGACKFIENHNADNQSVLVYSTRGMSRSASVIIAYLMYRDQIPLQQAYNDIMKCCVRVQPNSGFLEQLSDWDTELSAQRYKDV